MSGDRLELDLVQVTIIRLHVGKEISDKERSEFEALVEIAKAARLIQAFDQAGGNDWWEAHAKLYAALARLDSGATEGDAK